MNLNVTPNHEELGNLSQKYKGLGMKSRMRGRGYASRRKMEWKYFVTKMTLRTQYAQSGEGTKTKSEQGVSGSVSPGKEGRRENGGGQLPHGWERTKPEWVPAGPLLLCPKQPEEQCGNVGWLVFQDSSPGSALPLRFHTLHPPKKGSI